MNHRDDDADDEPLGPMLDRQPGMNSSALLLRLMAIAVVIPCTAVAVIWAWGRYNAHQFSNKEIRFLCLLVWASTMVILAIASIGGRHGKNSVRGRDGRMRLAVPILENQTAIEKWEQRNTRRLLLRICGAMLGVPLICLFAIVFYFNVQGIALEPKALKNLAPFLWGGGLTAGVIVAFRSTRERLLYSQQRCRSEEVELGEEDSAKQDLPDDSA